MQALLSHPQLLQHLHAPPSTSARPTSLALHLTFGDAVDYDYDQFEVPAPVIPKIETSRSFPIRSRLDHYAAGHGDHPTPIKDLVIFRPTPHRDERGYFMRTFDVNILTEAGIDPNGFKQENQSRSYQGVVRGLHGRSGEGEAKLGRV